MKLNARGSTPRRTGSGLNRKPYPQSEALSLDHETAQVYEITPHMPAETRAKFIALAKAIGRACAREDDAALDRHFPG